MFDGKRVCVIAEAGVNHNGSLLIAKQLVDVALDAGADVVKFQTFNPTALVTLTASTAAYQVAEGYQSQRELLQSLVLSESDLVEIQTYCQSRRIQFLSTAFDLDSVALLNRLGQTIWKIPSGEITNAPLVESIGRIAQQVIVSTGMATMAEIETVLMWLTTVGCPRKRITVLHCNTDYPTSFTDVNLRAMQTIGATFDVRVGYSDHTLGIEVPIAAVALGATVIEKHFTLDRSLPGPDHKASLEGCELKSMVAAIRNVELALGAPTKQVTESERRNRPLVRKGIYAGVAIAAGEQFTPCNLTTKRPEGLISASEWHQVIGKHARRSYMADEPIQW
jgi:N,N'-diacetyllegionaminate synthase